MRRGAAGVGFAALLGAALVAPTPAAADRGADLEQLQDAIRASRERVAIYEREQRDLVETVEALDRAAALLRTAVADARVRTERARAESNRINAETDAIEVRLRNTERAMSRRAVALYKAGDRAGLRMLFAAGGIREFLARTSALRLLLGRDSELLERHRRESERLAAARLAADAATRAVEFEAAELRDRERELNSERASKQRVVARLQSDRAHERAALVELEQAARALEETLRSLRDAPAGSLPELGGSPFASLQRRLPPPVDAPVVRPFGRVVDAEFFTETLRNGVGYDAPLGARVRAVAAGHVRFAGWFRGFGRIVILDHGDGFFTVSGHLAELAVAVGDRVEAGDPVGTVGETGSLSGPQLYFEIRRAGRPLDPAEWLRQADSG